MKFPKDVSRNKIIKIFENLGFKIVRIGNHISMIKNNSDGSRTLDAQILFIPESFKICYFIF